MNSQMVHAIVCDLKRNLRARNSIFFAGARKAPALSNVGAQTKIRGPEHVYLYVRGSKKLLDYQSDILNSFNSTRIYISSWQMLTKLNVFFF